MKKILFRIVGIFTLLLTALSASAITSTEVNDLLLKEGSLPLVWDLTPFSGENPTAVMDTSDETNPVLVITPKPEGKFTLSFTFNTTTEAKTLVRLSYLSSFNNVDILLDDVKISSLPYYSPYYNWKSMDVILPTASVGKHEVKMIFPETSSQGEFKSNNLYVQQFRPLENHCVQEGSVPVTFKNDPENPWFVEDNGMAYSMNPNSGVSSEISFSFHVDNPGYLFFNHGCEAGTNYYLKLDGVTYYSYKNGSSNWMGNTWYVSPGEHTVTFNEDLYSDRNHSARLSSVYVNDTWNDINVTTPGELGASLLRIAPEGDIKNIQMLKVSGDLNSEDWDNLRKCSGLICLDISAAPRTSFPEGWMREDEQIRAVWLPEELVSVSKNMFYKSALEYIYVPSSVTTIKESAFYNSKLRRIDFGEETQLKTLKRECFAYTNITSIILPDSLEVLPEELFWGCTSLTHCNLPKKLKIIGGAAFKNTNVGNGFGEVIRLPEGIEEIRSDGLYYGGFSNAGLKGTLIIPESLKTLEYCAFYDNPELSRVELNTTLTWWGDYAFSGCEIKEIVSPSPTPPSSDVEGASFASTIVYIPDFAELAYKTGDIWYKYKNYIPSKEVATRDNWNISQPVRMGENRFYGRPSLKMVVGSSIVINGSTPQNYDKFTFYVNQSDATSNRGYLSDVESTDANELEQRLYLPANSWRFFTPAADVKMTDITNETTDSWKIRYYDGAQRAANNSNSGNWKDVPADGVLKRGQGYIAIGAVNSWLNLPVEKANHDQFFKQPEWETALDENPSESEANAGWTYVGNPYPTYFDIASIDLDAPITIWTGSTYKALSVTDDLYALQPMQGYFIQKPAESDAVRMLRSGRQVTSEVTIKHAPADRKKGRDFINLEITLVGDTVATDETRIVINEAASKAYNPRHDVAKFMSMDTSVAQIYTLDDDAVQLAINERDYADGNVFLGVYTPRSGAQYEIAAVSLDRRAFLYDAYTGIEHDLSRDPYIFVADRAGRSDNRFTIRLAPIATEVTDAAEVSTMVSGLKGAISVRAAEGSRVSIFNAAGQPVFNGVMEVSPLMVELPEGIYVVNVDGETYKKIVK